MSWSKVFSGRCARGMMSSSSHPALAAVVKSRGKLLCVDSVSGAGCLPLDTDSLGIDVLVTGSQKGWMAPPGVAIVAVSAEAYARSATAKLPRLYFDFQHERRF